VCAAGRVGGCMCAAGRVGGRMHLSCEIGLFFGSKGP